MEDKVRNAIIKECKMGDEMKYFAIQEAHEGITKTPNDEVIISQDAYI